VLIYYMYDLWAGNVTENIQ